MGAAALLHHRLHLVPRIPVATSPEANHRRSNRNDVVLSMRFSLIRDLDLPLRRPFAYHQITAVDIPRSRDRQPNNPAAMATKNQNRIETTSEDTKKEEKTTKEGKEEEKMKKKTASLPPPPEKPEPGDCCGSGCVRCVWDVYYDELDEYNKLCQPIPRESKLD